MNRFLVAIFLALSAVASHAQYFPNPQSIPVDGSYPYVFVADVNGDGEPDLIAQFNSEAVAPNIQVYLADKQHNYSLAGRLELPAGLRGFCMAADLNGDKKIDLACVIDAPLPGSPYLAAYMGNGDGTFATSPVMTTDVNFFAVDQIVATADFNRDGHADLIVAGSQSPSFVLLGDGTGHFTIVSAPANLAGGLATVADVNADGIPDLLSANGPEIALGKGDGTFTESQQYFYGPCIQADFEKTGRLSAACAADSSGQLLILHENADGTVNVSSPLATISLPGAALFTSPLAASDLNGDGILDLLLASDDGLQVMIGKSGLAFEDPVPYASGATVDANYLTGFLTDMDGDGHPDFVSSGPNRIYITHGSANGTLQSALLTESGSLLYTSNSADFDGDGIADLVTIGQPGINFLHGKGDGSFAAAAAVALPSGYSDIFGSAGAAQILVGDFNGDQKEDFLIPSGISTDNLLYLGKGDGTFADATSIPTGVLPAPTSDTTHLLRADLNGDHMDDVIQVGPTTINASLGQSDGSFKLAPTSFANGKDLNTAIALGDFNGDGKPDAVISFADHAAILSGNGDGTFTATTTTLTLPAIDGSTLITNTLPVLTTGDLDGDGKQDVVLMGIYVSPATDYYFGGTTNEYSTAFWAYYGNGDNTFSQPVQAGFFPNLVLFGATSGVLESSGRASLILWGDSAESASQQEASALVLITSLASRKFAAPLYLAGGEEIDSVHLADFNKDGQLDILASNGKPGLGFFYGANTVAVLLNQGSLVTGALTTAPQPSLAGQNYIATATLTPPASQTTPLAGSIQFAIDGASAGSAPLAGNTASLSIQSGLTAGNHAITASWPGDSNYWPVTVSATHTITDFTLTADASASVQGGQSATVNFQLQSLNGFADEIAISCGNLPEYASCSFTQTPVNLTANQTIKGQLVIETQQSSSALNHAPGILTPTLALLFPGALLLAFRRSIRAGLPFLLLAVITILSTGCGGGGGKGGPPHTPAGTYTITLTGIGSSTQLQHSASIKLVVSN